MNDRLTPMPRSKENKTNNTLGVYMRLVMKQKMPNRSNVTFLGVHVPAPTSSVELESNDISLPRVIRPASQYMYTSVRRDSIGRNHLIGVDLEVEPQRKTQWRIPLATETDKTSWKVDRSFDMIQLRSPLHTSSHTQDSVNLYECKIGLCMVGRQNNGSNVADNCRWREWRWCVGGGDGLAMPRVEDRRVR